MVRDDDFYVLIVDDDEDTRRILSALLEMRRIKVKEVPDGRQALLAIHKKSPGLIVLDLQMPDLHGLTTLIRLKLDIEKSLIPVVLLTAMPLTARQVAKLRGLALDVISKGDWSMEQIGDLIEEKLDSMRAS